MVAASGRTRSVAHTLEAPSPVTIGLFLLGSMRVERDFQYAGRDSLPLDAQAFPQPELLDLIAHVERLDDAERARALALLHAPSVAALRARLDPRITAPAEGGVVQVEQESFDGRSHLSVVLQADTSEAVLARSGPTVTVRSRSRTRARFTVRVTTDSPTLTALSREEIFNDDFRRFLAAARADTAHPERFRRLDREVRGMELLCYREKLMAGLPTFATYFGRDMLMTALLMTPVWAPAMPEHVIASALRKLSPTGDVSHEEALGGQAIRENAAEYNRLITSGQLARARGVLAHLAATRENYIMVDDDLQLPIVAARYLADPRVAGERKRRFLLTERRLQRLAANLSYVARQTAPYVQAPTAVNLVSFPQDADGRRISASWRDSRAGYAGGRFAMDVNVIWAPRAVAAIGTILDALHRLGFPQPALDSLAPAFRDAPLAAYVRNQAALERAVATWMGTERHFRVALSPSQGGGGGGGGGGGPHRYVPIPGARARLDRSADSHREYGSGDAAAPRYARSGPRSGAGGADHAALPRGAVRRGTGSPGGQRQLRDARRLGQLSPGPVSLTHGRVGTRRQRVAGRPGTPNPRRARQRNKP